MHNEDLHNLHFSRNILGWSYEGTHPSHIEKGGII